MSETVIITIIGFVGTFLSAIAGYVIAARKQRAEISKIVAEAGKAKADTANVIGDAWQKLFDELEERVTAQATHICELQKALAEKNAEIHALQCELSQLQSALTEKNGLVASQEQRIKDLESEVESLRKELDAYKPRTRKATGAA